MLKNYPVVLATAFVLLVASCQTVLCQQMPSTEQVKSKIARIGLGEKAKATIRLKDGGKVKGYIARVDENDFVMRDRKTDVPTTVRYIDVAKVEHNRGHSTARNIFIGVAITIGSLVAFGFIMAQLDD